MNSIAIACSLLLAAAPTKQAPKTAPAPKGDACEGHETAAGKMTEEQCHHDMAAPAAAAKSEGAVVTRGEKLKGLPPTDLSKLLASASEYDGKEVSLKATVRRACTKKGCWMELSSSEKGAGVRVTFKDYGFFVPLDSAGRTATVEGTVKVAELSEERAKHYESEGATVARSKDGKAREVQLVATAVELRAAGN